MKYNNGLVTNSTPVAAVVVVDDHWVHKPTTKFNLKNNKLFKIPEISAFQLPKQTNKQMNIVKVLKNREGLLYSPQMVQEGSP